MCLDAFTHIGESMVHVNLFFWDVLLSFSDWLMQVKESLRDDPRYKSVRHEDREVMFNEYISELKAAEHAAEREIKAKREEQVLVGSYVKFDD